MTGDQHEFVKVRFALERDAEGWPPAGSEGLWAADLGDRLARIDNNPWFARNIAAGDVVRTRVDDNGEHWFAEKVTWSGNCAIRVVPFKDGALVGSRQAVINLFAPLGVDGEGTEQFGMVSLNVPSDADLSAVKGLRGPPAGRFQWGPPGTRIEVLDPAGQPSGGATRQARRSRSARRIPGTARR